MDRKGILYGALIVSAVLFISGCETVPKKFKEEVSGIKTRVETLETRVEGVETKQTDIERTTSEQNQTIEEMKNSSQSSVRTNISIKSRTGKVNEKTRDIQTCLKNAGFYNGSIDGIKGRGTRRAIRDFQTANGLNSDGVVGPKTWEALSKYTTASSGSEEGTATK